MPTPASVYTSVRRQYMKPRHEVIQPEDGSYRLIPLTKGLSVKVSSHRYDFLMQWAWSYSNGYAVRGIRIGDRVVHCRMHRVILGLTPTDTLHVDHANRDKLDNRDENLRVVTVSQNMMNRTRNRQTASGAKGITPVRGKYQATITIGTFDTLEEAVAARTYYGKLIHGKFYREV